MPGAIDVSSASSIPYSKLRGKNVVITGGSNGIGLETAKELIKHGASVTIGDLQPPPKEVKAKYVKCNVLQWADQVALFKEAAKDRPIDTVMPNAGITEKGAFVVDESVEQKPDLMTLEINLIGVMYTTKLALAYLRKNENADRSIVLIGSMASYGAIPLAPCYSAAKHGVLGLYRSLRDLNDGIRVNLIAPWFVDTQIVTNGTKWILAGLDYARIEDVVASVVRFVADPTVNGHVISIDDSGPFNLESIETGGSLNQYKIFHDRAVEAYDSINLSRRRAKIFKDRVGVLYNIFFKSTKAKLFWVLLIAGVVKYTKK